jgi:hypothetical protein
MPDLVLPLNCPKCGKPLIFLWAEDEWHFYRCPTHLTVVLPPDGRLKVDDPYDSMVKH